MPDDRRRRRRAGHRRLAVGLALLALPLVAAGVIQVTSILEDALWETGKRHAVGDAELVASGGLSGVRSGSAPRSRDITEVVVWSPSGRVIYADPRGSRGPAPAVVGTAFSSGRTATTGGPDDESILVAVPTQGRGTRAVAEMRFSQAALRHELGAAKTRLYVVAAIGGALLYVALIPLVLWVARRLPSRDSRERERRLAGLEEALRNEELCLHYQPKLRARSGAVIGVEALVRWRHPQRGLLGPDEFVGLMESSHLLEAFNRYVLCAATAACARWQGHGLVLPVAVNISAAALRDQRVVRQVAEALTQAALLPSLLTVEITETALMEGGAEVSDTLLELRRLGVAVSIDDFGTGYSSLGRLSSLPLDELKIDRCFVNGADTDDRAMAVLRLIADIGREMQLSVTAEGVETEQELGRIVELGCDAVQGYLFARPMPEPELLAWLDRRERLGRPETIPTGTATISSRLVGPPSAH